MNILKAMFLGLVQGFTEFLPVSSSGHLAISRKLLGFNTGSGLYFDVMLHFGTLIALIIVFHEDIWHLIVEFFQMFATVFANMLIFFKRRKGDTRYTYLKVVNSNYKKLALMIIVATIPTAIIGYVGRDFAELASDMLWFVGFGLFGTAALLWLADRHDENTMKIKKATYSNSFFVGVAQGVATIPGVSRSGATIATGMMLGFNKKLAVKFSFLMSIPVNLGAIFLEIKGLKGKAFGSANLPGYVLGTIVAGVSGFFAIKYMLKLIKNKKYKGFSIYCGVMGLLAIIISFIK